jgi:DNA-directed RNA polymerase subunit RPC12/RpoP
MRTPDLFDKPPRKPRRVLARVADAGTGEDGQVVYFVCARCKWAEWMRARTVTEAKRGYPCPRCNQ